MIKNFSNIISDNNPYFLLAKNSKRLTHISLSSFIIPVLILFLAGIISQIILYPILFSENTVIWINDVYNLVVLFGFIILFVFLWIKYFEGRSIASLGFSKTNFIKDYFQGFISGLLLNSVIIGLIALFGSISIIDNSNNLVGFSALPVVLIFLFGFLIQGAAEEILSRGFVMQSIGARYKAWLGVFISTIFFAVLHLSNTGINYISVLNLVFVSILLSLFVLWKGNLWFACAWHSGWNWTMGNVFGLSVSGHSDKATLIDLTTQGPEIISGGAFGPEGSIITTIVFIIALFIFVKINSLKKS